MAEWPDISQLLRVLNVREGEDYQEGDPLLEVLEGYLAAAIQRVKLDIGWSDDFEDEPDDMLARAALRMAELMSIPQAPDSGRRPGIPLTSLSDDPKYRDFLVGHRRVFGIA